MVNKTSIEWAQNPDGSQGRSWNPLRGCTRVSPGCVNCYAERLAARFCGPGEPFYGFAGKKGGEARWTGKVAVLPDLIDAPRRWRKPFVVFVNSMSDLFHESVPESVIHAILDVIQDTPQHRYIILTKRAERMREIMNARPTIRNLDLGVSVENQEYAEKRIPILLDTKAAVRIISVEPMLGPVDPTHIKLDDGTELNAITALDQVIIGGESGPRRRPFDLAWAYDLVRRCRAFGTPVFFKQIDKKIPIPPDLMIRQLPRGREVAQKETML